MRKPTFIPLRWLAASLTASSLILVSAAHAQIAGGTDVNLSQKTGSDSECAISKNPTNAQQLFALCNTAGAGLFAARSTNGGVTWTYPDPADKTIADGDAGQGPAACCDPNLAWDTFGNLFLTYIDAATTNIVTILSTDGGGTFANLASFGPASVDQPTVVVANTTAPGTPVAIWIVWNQGVSMVARGAAVTALGTVGAFGALQNIPGTASCSFGDVAISPAGVVVQACGNPIGGEGPSTIRINADADGLGAANFGATIAATTTNVGGFDFITPQNARSVDPEAGLAFDGLATSPRFGRLYLVYTEETVAENNDTDIMLRFSDNNGSSWSAPIRVNDDATSRSQFLPKIAVNAISGHIAVCWHDARNSAANTAAEEFCTVAKPDTPTPAFMTNGRISDGASTSNGLGVEFGDYAGLAYVSGIAHPIWGDASNSTANNPNIATNFDAYTDRVTSGRPGIVHICVISPNLCPLPDFGPYVIVINCLTIPCHIKDPIPRNCLVKFVCPGCPPGGLCPPWYSFAIDLVDPAWQVGLYDPLGYAVPYQLQRTPTGIVISFRPTREFFKDGKIGDYYFAFETSDRSKLNREQKVRMTVRAGNEPLGSQPK